MIPMMLERGLMFPAAYSTVLIHKRMLIILQNVRLLIVILLVVPVNAVRPLTGQQMPMHLIYLHFVMDSNGLD